MLPHSWCDISIVGWDYVGVGAPTRRQRVAVLGGRIQGMAGLQLQRQFCKGTHMQEIRFGPKLMAPEFRYP